MVLSHSSRLPSHWPHAWPGRHASCALSTAQQNVDSYQSRIGPRDLSKEARDCALHWVMRPLAWAPAATPAAAPDGGPRRGLIRVGAVRAVRSCRAQATSSHVAGDGLGPATRVGHSSCMVVTAHRTLTSCRGPWSRKRIRPCI